MLCYKCQGHMFIANIGHCGGCGAMTSSGAFKLCAKCAQSKNQCAACGGALDAKKPAVTPDTKGSFIVMVDYDHFCGKAASTDRAVIAQRAQQSFADFKNQVAALLAQNNLPADSFKSENELTFIGAMMVTCTYAVADLLKQHPGVSSVSENV